MDYLKSEPRPLIRDAGTGWARPTLPFAPGGPRVGRDKKSLKKPTIFLGKFPCDIPKLPIFSL